MKVTETFPSGLHICIGYCEFYSTSFCFINLNSTLNSRAYKPKLDLGRRSRTISQGLRMIEDREIAALISTMVNGKTRGLLE